MIPIEQKLDLNDVHNPDGHLSFAIKANHHGIYIQPKGYGDNTSQIDVGCPVVIEYKNGEPFVVIYGDINSEEPTHNISLAGAKESLRKEEEDA